jgi:hypothetical protein
VRRGRRQPGALAGLFPSPDGWPSPECSRLEPLTRPILGARDDVQPAPADAPACGRLPSSHRRRSRSLSRLACGEGWSELAGQPFRSILRIRTAEAQGRSALHTSSLLLKSASQNEGLGHPCGRGPHAFQHGQIRRTPLHLTWCVCYLMPDRRHRTPGGPGDTELPMPRNRGSAIARLTPKRFASVRARALTSLLRPRPVKASFTSCAEAFTISASRDQRRAATRLGAFAT